MLARWLQTVRHLRMTQIYHRAFRAKPVVADAEALLVRQAKGSWALTIPRASAQTGQHRFRFLNIERHIETWNDYGLPKLWLYNLHYHECPSSDLIHAWIAGNPPMRG